jgi:hypothetical protein
VLSPNKRRENVEPNPNSSVFSSAHGPTYSPIFVERKVKVYAIHEFEISNLALLSGIQNTAASVGGGALGFTLSIGWDVLTSADSIKQQMGRGVIFVAGLVFLVCAGVWIWAACKRKTSLEQILDESRVVPRNATT